MNHHLKRRRLTPPPTPSTKAEISPTLPPLCEAVKSSSSHPSRLLSPPPLLPSPSNMISSTAMSPPSSSLFRPEPILPTSESYRRSLPPQGNPNYMDERHSHYHHNHHPSGERMHYSHRSNSYNRSAFTPTTVRHSDYPSPPSVNHPFYSYHSVQKPHHQAMPPAATSSLQPSDIPVVYAPSNKKRKKYPPMIMPADGKKSPTQPHTKNQQIEPSQHHRQQQHMQQQISTAVRTYYEVDRDTCGQYILPVEIDSWTVVDLGTVVYDRPAYHNQRYIYPVGYTVRK